VMRMAGIHVVHPAASQLLTGLQGARRVSWPYFVDAYGLFIL
jgi:hypothetical protein